jgi:hypothetical protein
MEAEDDGVCEVESGWDRVVVLVRGGEEEDVVGADISEMERGQMGFGRGSRGARGGR